MSEIFYFYSSTIESTYPFVVDKMKLKEIYARGSINIACSACFKPIFQHEIHIFFFLSFLVPSLNQQTEWEKKRKSLLKKHALLFVRSFHSIHPYIHGNYYTIRVIAVSLRVRSKSIKTLLVLVWILMTKQFKQFIDFNQCFDQISRNQHWSTDFQFDLLVFDTQMPDIV